MAKIWLADKRLSPLGNEHFTAYQKMVQQLLNIDQYKNWLNQTKTGFENYQNLPQNFVKSLYFSRLIFEWKKIGNRKYLTIKGLKTFITYLKNSASRKNGLFNDKKQNNSRLKKNGFYANCKICSWCFYTL